MKLSFIVPVYNVRDYLSKCIESLLCQDYNDYEIVIVDDGSTDGSRALVDEWSKKSDKIIIHHQANRGLSVARNTGVEIASGDYVAFVDSDDYWSDNVLSALMNQITLQQLDVLRFRYQNVRESGESFIPNKAKDINDYSPEPTSGKEFLDQRMGLQCYACQFIVRRSICCAVYFKEGVFFEDVDWMPRIMMVANRVSSSDIIVYNYLWRQNSITLAANLSKCKKKIEDKISLIESLEQHKSECEWLSSMISALLVSVLMEISKSVYGSRSLYLEKIQNVVTFPLTKKRLDKRSHWKIFMINISPALAVKIFRLMIRLR